MRKLLLAFTLLLAPFYFIHAQTYLPTASGEIIQHTYYTLSYVETHEQPEWVYYMLTPDMLVKNVNRTDDFRADENVTTGSASLEDYKASGYDRGHLCPAGDMVHSKESMSESFYLSNMSPQEPSFNRGAWKKLEAIIRYWGSQDTIFVVTGPVFEDNMGSIGDNQVTIPGYYYKVIYAPKNRQMIGFIMPNTKISDDITTFALSVDEVEKHTGIDFFPELEDTLETELESQSNNTAWVFREYTNSTPTAVQTTETEEANSIQCKGISKSSGQRCKNNTNNANGYCHLHQSQANN